MKKSLILLHGALGSKNQFQPLKPFLKTDFEIYDLNFEGHGGVDTNQDYSIDLFTENALKFIDTQGLDSVNIFGYSMGGYVALNMALQRPGAIAKIVTLGTKFNWDNESTSREVGMLDPEKIKEKVPGFAAKLQEEHAPSDWEEIMRKTADMMIDLSRGKAIPNDRFKEIRQEVVIGVGSKDQMVTFSESELVADLIPNGKVQRIEGFPHPIDKIEPGELALYIQGSF